MSMPGFLCRTIFTFYVGPATVPCLRVLSFFGQNRYRRRNYQQYVQKGVTLGRRPELVGGGLVRSLGGWSEVLALRGRGEKQRSDQRIIGDSEFVQDVISGLDDLVKKNLRLSGQTINIAALAQLVCKKYNISPGELRSPWRCKSRRASEPRRKGRSCSCLPRSLYNAGSEVLRLSRRVNNMPKSAYLSSSL